MLEAALAAWSGRTFFVEFSDFYHFSGVICIFFVTT